MRTTTQQNYLENIRKMVIGKIWVKAMAAAIALATALNACSSDDGDGGSCSISDYKTVQIGSQTWMAENLNCNVSGSVCHMNISSRCSEYGRLYNWEQAMKACPSGWYLPSGTEWTMLTNFAGGNIAGTKLKATSGWNSGGNGTDDYGFSALPGGYIYLDGSFDGSFSNAGSVGNWWSSTEGSRRSAYYLCMYYDFVNVVMGLYDKDYYRSVRCVKD